MNIGLYSKLSLNTRTPRPLGGCLGSVPLNSLVKTHKSMASETQRSESSSISGTYEWTLTAVRVPPPPKLLGPRVEHLSIPREDLLSVIVSEALLLPQWFVLELIGFGALYHCEVMPQMKGPQIEHSQAAREERQRALATKA